MFPDFLITEPVVTSISVRLGYLGLFSVLIFLADMGRFRMGGVILHDRVRSQSLSTARVP
jgi:hypothetical protein